MLKKAYNSNKNIVVKPIEKVELYQRYSNNKRKGIENIKVALNIR
jgi:hypothetical protein